MSHEKTSNGRRKILIVEDDESIRLSLGQLLDFEGYDVALSIHGKQAMDYLRSGGRPDLVLLDLMMPIMSGHEFLVWLRQERGLCDLPVILLSAVPQGQSIGGVQLRLRKPIDVDSLLEHVADLIKNTKKDE